MKTKSLILVICLMMMFGLAAPFVSAPGLIVQTNTSTYQSGDNLTVNLSGGTPNSIVMVQFNNPLSVPKWVVQGVLSAGGSYSYTLKVPSSWEDGTWTVRVKDQTTSSFTTFTVSNVGVQPPTNKNPIANAGPASSIVVGDSATLDGSASSDPDGIIVSYSWDFGDGTTGSGVKTTHIYNVVGVYTVTLTVRDNLGATGTATTTVTVKENQKPVANAGSSRKIFAGRVVDFDGSGSSDPDGTITKYEWNFGDGSTGTGVGVSHSYSAKGTFTVTLTVTDNKGATGTASLTVKVEEFPAKAKNEADTKFTGAQTNAVIDALATMGVKVKLNTTGDVSVYLIEYETNPHPEAPKPKNMLAKYLDISFSNPDAIKWPVYIEVHYTDEDVAGLDESTLVLYYFSGGSWKACSNSGVNTVDNYIWAYLTREEAAGSPLSIGTQPTVAQFTYSNLQINPTQVNTGAMVTVQVTVRNIGDLEGTATVDLYINSVKEQTKSATLAGGASTTVSFSVSKATAGTYAVKIGDQTGSFTVVTPPTPASFTYSGLTVSPAEVGPGVSVSVSVTVTNTGQQSGTYSAELKLDGTTTDTKTGTLAGGASTTVGFTVSSQVQGTHNVQVGTQTGSFRVTAPPPTPPDYTWYIIGIVVVAVVIVAAYFLMKRKPKEVAT